MPFVQSLFAFLLELSFRGRMSSGAAAFMCYRARARAHREVCVREREVTLFFSKSFLPIKSYTPREICYNYLQKLELVLAL